MQTFDEYQATLPMPIGPKLDNRTSRVTCGWSRW